MSLFLDWTQLNGRIISSNKKVALYGRSEDWVHKALGKITSEPQVIIDRNPKYSNTSFYGVRVCPIEAVNHTEYFFVITAGDYEGIVEGLESRGLIAGIDFACSPDFKDYRLIKDFYDRTNCVLISCSDYNDRTRARSSSLGGGLFWFDTESGELVKKVEGSFRQIEIIDEKIYAVEYVNGELWVLESNLKVLDRWKLPGTNICGLAVDAEDKIAYSANAGNDQIYVSDLSQSAKVIETLEFFSRPGLKRESHVNDLTFCAEKLFVSCFSTSGNYKHGVFDGGVLQLDLKTQELAGPLLSGLWKPHSPRLIDGNLMVLDSMRGDLVFGTGERLNVGGFVRGLDANNNSYFIGQSQDMYISDRLSQGSAIPVDPGFYVLDKLSFASRFYPLPKLMNVHDLRVL